MKRDKTQEDFRYIFAGEEMSAEQAAQVAQRLTTQPNDLRARLMMLGYYQSTSNATPSINDQFQHALWMIDNHPAHYVSQYIHWAGHSSDWTPAMSQQASKHWHAQLRKHPKNSRVVAYAAEFFDDQDKAVAESLLKKAARLDPNWVVPVRRLAQTYRAKAIRAKTKANRIAFARLAIRWAEKAFALHDTRGERVGMLTEFTHVAIRYGHLSAARKYVKRLEYYGTIMPLWNQYSLLYSLWLAFIDDKPRSALFRLKALVESFEAEPTHVSASTVSAALITDLLERGQHQDVEKFIEFMIPVTADKVRQELYQAWLLQIRRGAKPKIEWPSKAPTT